jgi:hypothetical protein
MSFAPVLLSVAFLFVIVHTGGLRQQFLKRLDDHATANYLLTEKYANSDHLTDFPGSGKCKQLGEFTEQFSSQILECASKLRTVLIFGDSHAMNVYNALRSIDRLPSVMAIASGGCALGNENRHCDAERILRFVAGNQKAFLCVIYTEAGFRLFKTRNDVQSERESFNTAASIESLRSDIPKVEEIAIKLSRALPDAKLIWLGPWVEPHYDLNSKQNILRLDQLSLDKSFAKFAQLDATIAESVRSHGPSLKYVSTNQALQLSPSTSLIRGECLLYSDRDHLSTCGESVLGARLLPEL